MMPNDADDDDDGNDDDCDDNDDGDVDDDGNILDLPRETYSPIIIFSKKNITVLLRPSHQLDNVLCE